MFELGSKAKQSLEFLAALQHGDVTIKKTGYNSFGGYWYPTLDDILTAIQPMLVKYGCIVVWSEIDHGHEQEVLGSEKGTDYYVHTDSTVACKILNAYEPQDYIGCLSHGYGINKNADKTCKATTIAKRYSLINLLGIKAVNDEDTDNPKFDVQNSQQMGEAAKAFRNRKARSRSVNIDEQRANSDTII